MDVIAVPDPKAVAHHGDTFVIQRPMLCGICEERAFLRQYVIGGKAGLEVSQRPLNDHVYRRPCHPG